MIKYELIRSKRRTLGMEVTGDLRVVVRAPQRCSLQEIERFVVSHEDWIERALARQRTRVSSAIERQLTPESEARLRALAVEVIERRVAYYSELMGLTPTSVRITGAKKRFGSCSGNNGLCFSWRLMLYPSEAIDYVVVHELAHIRHHDHSAAFYDLVAQYLPDHRERRALLRG